MVDFVMNVSRDAPFICVAVYYYAIVELSFSINICNNLCAANTTSLSTTLKINRNCYF